MGAALDNAASLQDIDDVGVDHRGKPVSNHDGCASRHQLCQRLLHATLGFGGECAGRFIEQQDGRVFQHCAGDCNALALTARQLDAARSNLSVIALRQRLDEVVSPGMASRSLDCLRIRVLLAIGDVRSDVVVEQHDVLADQGYLSA